MCEAMYLHNMRIHLAEGISHKTVGQEYLSRRMFRVCPSETRFYCSGLNIFEIRYQAMPEEKTVYNFRHKSRGECYFAPGAILQRVPRRCVAPHSCSILVTYGIGLYSDQSLALRYESRFLCSSSTAFVISISGITFSVQTCEFPLLVRHEHNFGSLYSLVSVLGKMFYGSGPRPFVYEGTCQVCEYRQNSPQPIAFVDSTIVWYGVFEGDIAIGRGPICGTLAL